MAKRRKKNIANSGVQPGLQNDAKTLFANIRFSSIDDEVRTIVVTSSVPDEGKTTTAVNLANAIATSGKTVCLVEADMRRRNLASVLDIHPPAGMYAYMSGQEHFADIVNTTPIPNLFFIDSEPSIPNPADIVSSKRYQAFMERLASEFDYVIYDTPPVNTFVDAAIVASAADGVLLVAKTAGTKRREVAAALDQLMKAKAHVLGLVMTFCEDTTADYYYAYYQQSVDMKGKKKEKRVK